MYSGSSFLMLYDRRADPQCAADDGYRSTSTLVAQ